ncbi:MAG: sigma 54-interacting transcriptional regulator [Treponema sp.]|nr:sigma 54-interacting transcriptional regulator [Treponema sp.]
MKRRVSISFIKPSDRFLSPEELLNAGFIGISPAIERLRHQIITFANTNEPLLLEGETGTGKSTAAEILHLLSDRRENNFFPVNVSSIPENLVESTLFGAEKGSFTDATEQEGFCGKADRGTLFLDEISTLGLNNQTKLNQLLDRGIFYKVGSNVPVSADIKFILATNENLELKVLRGEFKKDLFYRISFNRIRFPSLRERMEDIPMLAKASAAEKGKYISEEAIKVLYESNWPGNVRQLKGRIYNAAIKTKSDTIQPEDLI